MSTEDLKPEDGENKVTRLVDLLVHEVSLVDYGANRQKWLIRKRQEDNVKGKKVTIGGDGLLTTVKNDPFGTASSTEDNTDDVNKKVKIAKIAKAVKDSISTVASSAKEAISVIVDAVKSAEVNKEKGTIIPAVVSGPISRVTSSLLGIITTYPTEKSVSPDIRITEHKADDKTTYRVEGAETGVLFGEYSSKEDADKRVDEISEFKPPVVKIKKSDASEDKAQRARKLLWMVMDKINDGAFMDEGEKSLVDSMLGMLKEAVVKQAEDLGQLIFSPEAKADITKILEEVSGEIDAFVAEIEKAEETEEALPAPMPDILGLELAKIAHKMIGLVTKYSTPEDGKEEDEDAPDDDDITKLLAEVIGKLSADKSEDESVVQLLSKARDLLGESQPSAGKSSKQKEPVEKRGAKISAARRKKFKEAMKILVSLFDEVVPDGEKVSWPNRNTTKSAKTEINKATSQIEALEKRQEKVKVDIDKSETELRKVRKELSKEMKRVQPSNAAWVDQVPGEEDLDKVDKNAVNWPADLNTPESW